MHDSEQNISGKTLISVIDEFDSSTQNEAYNKSFRKWRSNKENPYAFNFETNTRESVFNDSRGFESHSCSEAEERIVGRIVYLIGIVMLMFVVIDDFLGGVLANLLSLFGLNIHASFFTASMYGSGAEIVIIMVTVAVVELVVPMLFVHSRLKMPFRLGFMSKVNDSTEIINSIAVTFIICTVVCLPAAYSGTARDIYTYFSRIDADVSAWGQTEFIVYIVFDIVIVPVISEMLYRGAMFGALRQFGDIFAIIVTSVVPCIVSRNLTEIPAVLMISVVASVGMLRSGTILTAFFVRIIYRMYNLALIMLESSSSIDALIIRNGFMLITCAVGAIGVIVIYLIKKSSRRRCIARYKWETPPVKILYVIVRTFPFTAVTGICFLETILRLIM